MSDAVSGLFSIGFWAREIFRHFICYDVVKLSFGTMTLYGPQIEADEGPRTSSVQLKMT
jgi:hypothetical protein